MPLHLLSCTATKAILNAICADYSRQSGVAVRVESVGDVDAARRVRAGEAFDVVALAQNAIQDLTQAGHLVPGSQQDLYLSGVVAGVRAGAQTDAVLPEFSSEEAVKQAVLAAKSVGYSTGPSGVALAKLFDRWGIAGQIQGKITVAPAGVPVAGLVASGQVELGFQQLSEMKDVPGLQLLAWLRDPARAQATRAQGMKLL
jgi:molybdate transport system substrate-binding protein